MNVFTKPMSELEVKNYVPRSYPKSPSETKFLTEALLGNNFIFSSLPTSHSKLMIDAMEMKEYAMADEIIIQGDTETTYFYLMNEGTVTFNVSGNNVGSCTRGGGFGELALLYDCPRAATCTVTSEKASVWRVDRATFQLCLRKFREESTGKAVEVLRQVEGFAQLDEDVLKKVGAAMTEVSFGRGQCIVKKNDTGKAFYIIMEGKVRISNIGHSGKSNFSEHTLSAGEYFGERSLITNERRAADITVSSDTCRVLALDKESFDKYLGSFTSLLAYCENKRILKSVPTLAASNLEGYQVDKLMSKMETVTLKSHETVTGANLYFITDGCLITDSGSELRKGDYFGGNFGAQDALMARAKDVCTCSVLTAEGVREAVGKDVQLGRPMKRRESQIIRGMTLKECERIRILGIGTFGRVWIVKHQTTSKTYALKILDKEQIVSHHQAKGVMREKEIMDSLKHPFIVGLVATFKDDAKLYMLVNLYQGGELFSVLHTRQYDGVPADHAAFYAQCIMIGLAHMHDRKICYRDLKPENVMIDNFGYPVIVDLGFAKIVPERTYTLCGTPEYLAPEIILSKGHNKGVDIWAFGVLVFEMIYGFSPFYSEGVDQVTLFKRIVQVRFSFPSRRGTEESTDLISKLLVKRPTYRLGCAANGTGADILSHPFFVHEHDVLYNRQLTPPWVPEVKNNMDTGNFDSYALEERDEERQKGKKKKVKLTREQQAAFDDF